MNLVENYAALLSASGPLDLLYAAVVHLGPLFALVVGRRLERGFAAFLLLALVLSWGTFDLDRTKGLDGYTAWAIVCLIVVGGIALRRGAPAWTLFAAAFQLLLVLTYLVGLAASIPMESFGFLTMVRAWIYLFVFSLMIGAWHSRFGSSAGARGRSVLQPGPAAGGAPG
jgi:hypothetical protein